MDEARDRARELFLEVCNLDAAAREAVLDRECAGDPGLRSKVEALLNNHPPPTSPMSSSLLYRADPPQPTPETIGGYRVLRQLGKGGMGFVYLGVREVGRFSRHAAVKVLRRDRDTKDILRRFDLERQVLGAMNHPNIARLYEAGETDEGSPYFAMEYVDGQQLDDYCDSRRLPITDRLDLFRKVCSAVHYAHQNLVVHRDLKPKNVLVTRDGEPKLLDFGISKIINPDLVFGAGGLTESSPPPMTREYASPEQVRGEPITTASDIYTLGVILYELVSGHRPYQLRTPQDVTRFVCDEDPDKPSTKASQVEEFPSPDDQSGSRTSTITPASVSRVREGRPDRLRRRLSGDVDNIVLMAMRKEPQRRYQSAEQLGEDIRRHLDGLPVIARPDTLTYRCGKFVRRHRVGVGAAAAIVLLLVGGIASTTRALQAEQRQHQRADLRFQQVRSLAEVFMFDFYDMIKDVDGTLEARHLLVTTALEYLDGLVKEAAEDATLARDVAKGYDQIGDIRGGIRSPSLGDTGGALENYRAGLDLRMALVAGGGGELELQKELSTSYMHVGDMLGRRGQIGAALDAYRSSLELRRQLAQADPKYRRVLHIGLNNVGVALVAVGQLGEAKQLFDRSLAKRRELLREAPGDELKRRDVAVQLNDLGDLLKSMGDLDGALRQYQEGLDIRLQLFQEDQVSGKFKRDAGLARYQVGGALLSLGRLVEAREQIEGCFQLFEQRTQAEPLDARGRKDLAVAHELRGQLKAQEGDAAGAAENYRAFHALMLELSEKDQHNRDYKAILADSYERLAEASLVAGDAAGAAQFFGRAMEIAAALAEDDPENVLRLEGHASALAALGGALYQLQDVEGARHRLEQARSIYEKLRLAEPEHAGVRLGLASTLHLLCGVAATGGSNQDALALAGEAMELVRGLAGDPQTTALRTAIEGDLFKYAP